MLYHRSKKQIIVFLLILTTFGSGFNAPKCGGSKDEQVRALAKAEDDVAQGLLSAAKILTEAKADGTLSEADISFMKPILESVNNTNGRLIEITKKYSDLTTIPENEQQQILDLISLASSELSRLNNEGIFRIKDPKKRAAFNILVLSLQATATSAVQLFPLFRKDE